ncbi:hypothetical protein H5410_051846 [Solanum commersonii]|uniref:6-phosphogluconate dehydrogenase NADP-binding domain-containing protein n=1 Tax=Solanum commersonii TaxID=4109 RepID=A0A9J5WZK5_SOLCO|nr:hypothetical protein H5410_051846 [Solanum commersonii]
MTNSSSSLKLHISQEIINPSSFNFSIPSLEESHSTPVYEVGEMGESNTPHTEMVVSPAPPSGEVLPCSPTLVLSGANALTVGVPDLEAVKDVLDIKLNNEPAESERERKRQGKGKMVKCHTRTRKDMPQEEKCRSWDHLFEAPAPYLHEPGVREFYYKMELLSDRVVKTTVKEVKIFLDEETLGIILGVAVKGIRSIEGCKPSADDLPTSIGFLGLGIMGNPMAQNFIKGPRANVSPLSPWVQSKYESSPEEVESFCDVIFVMLADPESAANVACGKYGAAKGMGLGKGVNDSGSTYDSDSVNESED